MSGCCSKKQQAKNARQLRPFLEALQGLEKKHSATYEYTGLIAKYLDGWSE